jgi:hypothetical protein
MPLRHVSTPADIHQNGRTPRLIRILPPVHTWRTDMSLKIWNVVPDGSRIELSLDGDGAFVGRARVLKDTDGDVQEETWEDDELHPGPRVATLRSPTRYTIRVAAAFAGAETTVTIRARIVTPSGAQHGSAFAFATKGQKGSTPARATLIALMD